MTLLGAMTALVVILALLLVPAVGLALFLRPDDELGIRLRGAFSEGHTIYVGFPLEAPEGWRLVRSISSRRFETNDGASFALSRVRSFVVADKKSGVLIEARAPLDPLPLGVSALSEALGSESDAPFTEASLQAGAQFLKVTLHRAPSGRENHVSIVLENVGRERLRIYAYAPYQLTAIGPLCATIGKSPFSRFDVRDHFQLGRGREWIEPEERVVNLENATDLTWTWVFFFDSERGVRGHAGASSVEILPRLSAEEARPKRSLPALPGPAVLLSLAAQLDSLNAMDLYAVLGVARNAPVEAIKKAFLLATKKWHPSQFSGAPESEQRAANEIFLRIKQAHDTLVDPAKRAAYDRRSERGTG